MYFSEKFFDFPSAIMSFLVALVKRDLTKLAKQKKNAAHRTGLAPKSDVSMAART